MEIDAENVNYLISRCIRLEKWNGRLEKRIEGANEAIDVHRKDIEQLEHQLKHKDECIKELEAEVKLENENKRSQHVNLCLQIEDLEKDCKELADVIRGLDPTNPILQHLTI